MKVAIIGAGICGTYLAKNLAEKGNEVTVFERKRTVGKECCSGLFSSRLFDFIPEAATLATNRINGAVINFPKKSIHLRFRSPFFVIEHAQLDLLMAALATQAGANIRVGKIVDGKRLEQMEKDYDRIIGCDGALSPTRTYILSKTDESGRSKTPAGRQESYSCQTSLSGNASPRVPFSGISKKTGLCPGLDFMIGIQGIEEKADSSDIVETWATKNGFIWKIPRGENVEWGIMEKQNVARTLFDDFIATKKIKICRLKSAIIPQGLILPKNEKITLCGDASGLTKPWSGGGVIWNLTQAGILLKNFPNFLQYRKEACSFFGLRIRLGKLAKIGAYTAGFNFPAFIPKNIILDGDYLIRK